MELYKDTFYIADSNFKPYVYPFLDILVENFMQYKNKFTNDKIELLFEDSRNEAFKSKNNDDLEQFIANNFCLYYTHLLKLGYDGKSDLVRTLENLCDSKAFIIESDIIDTEKRGVTQLKADKIAETKDFFINLHRNISFKKILTDDENERVSNFYNLKCDNLQKSFDSRLKM